MQKTIFLRKDQFKSESNSIGYDGLCSLANFDMKKIKKVPCIGSSLIWSVVLLVVTNAPKET